MKNIVYEYHEGSWENIPQEVDNTSSATVVYLRKNVRQITKESTMGGGEPVTLWAYDEAELTHPEYLEYLAEQTAAKVDYIAMMSNIDFEGGV